MTEHAPPAQRFAASPAAQAIAVAWGCAEAIAWFVIPDVWGAWVVLMAPRRIGSTLASIVAGALAGSLVLSGIVALTGGIGQVLVALPGIGQADLAQAASELQASGPPAMLGGVLQGLPLKVYVHEAALLHVSLPGVLLFALLNRIERVGLSLLVAAGVGLLLRRLVAARPWLATAGYVVVWAVIYVAYFSSRGL